MLKPASGQYGEGRHDLHNCSVALVLFMPDGAGARIVNNSADVQCVIGLDVGTDWARNSGLGCMLGREKVAHRSLPERSCMCIQHQPGIPGAARDGSGALRVLDVLVGLAEARVGIESGPAVLVCVRHGDVLDAVTMKYHYDGTLYVWPRVREISKEMLLDCCFGQVFSAAFVKTTHPQRGVRRRSRCERRCDTPAEHLAIMTKFLTGYRRLASESVSAFLPLKFNQ